ncbi:transcription termination factor Rho [Candidatus Collierbacteria bacterium]|nr:transcription termination factor Rho [Candidatus Collierbacteria bacterium]
MSSDYNNNTNDGQGEPYTPYNNSGYGGGRPRGRYNDNQGYRIPDADLPTETITGVLDDTDEGHGLIRIDITPSPRDAYISTSQIRRFNLRSGDLITGPARAPKDNERYWGLLRVDLVNGIAPDEAKLRARPWFDRLTAIYPDERLTLETTKDVLSTRVIDLIAPIGKGQRGLIVSPPKAGKTTILKDIMTGVAANFPDVTIMAVLIGERPEEVTDIKRHLSQITAGSKSSVIGSRLSDSGQPVVGSPVSKTDKPETDKPKTDEPETENGKLKTDNRAAPRHFVAASNFDEKAEDQTIVAEVALERAKRIAEAGGDVVIVLDSITRLARAYNLAIPTSGRTLSGGFDPAALYPPKRFFGAARNFEEGGSITIIGTALVDTGSRMDELIFEEFKGTGNMELHLDRKLADRRVWPAYDLPRSGTRKEELLFSQSDYQSIVTMRRMIDILSPDERTEIFLDRLRKTKSNKEFLASLKEG